MSYASFYGMTQHGQKNDDHLSLTDSGLTGFLKVPVQDVPLPIAQLALL